MSQPALYSMKPSRSLTDLPDPPVGMGMKLTKTNGSYKMCLKREHAYTLKTTYWWVSKVRVL